VEYFLQNLQNWNYSLAIIPCVLLAGLSSGTGYMFFFYLSHSGAFTIEDPAFVLFIELVICIISLLTALVCLFLVMIKILRGGSCLNENRKVQKPEQKSR